MIRCKSDSSPFVIQQLHDALLEQGIDCVIRNQFLSGALGELPVQETELWLINDGDLAFAQKTLDEIKHIQSQSQWTCSHCNEPQEGEFNVCWKCQTLRSE